MPDGVLIQYAEGVLHNAILDRAGEDGDDARAV